VARQQHEHTNQHTACRSRYYFVGLIFSLHDVKIHRNCPFCHSHDLHRDRLKEVNLFKQRLHQQHYVPICTKLCYWCATDSNILNIQQRSTFLVAKRVSEIFWSKTCSGMKRKFGQQRNSILPLQQYQRTTTAGLQLLYSACTTETSNPKMLRWCFGASMRTGPCPYQKFHYCIWKIFSITINVAIIFVQVLNFDSLHLGVYHSWCKNIRKTISSLES